MHHRYYRLVELEDYEELEEVLSQHRLRVLFQHSFLSVEQHLRFAAIILVSVVVANYPKGHQQVCQFDLRALKNFLFFLHKNLKVKK